MVAPLPTTVPRLSDPPRPGLSLPTPAAKPADTVAASATDNIARVAFENRVFAASAIFGVVAESWVVTSSADPGTR